MRAAVTKASDDIKAGRVVVHDFMSNQRLPGAVNRLMHRCSRPGAVTLREVL
jgi:hypothetical protein